LGMTKNALSQGSRGKKGKSGRTQCYEKTWSWLYLELENRKKWMKLGKGNSLHIDKNDKSGGEKKKEK